MTQPDYHVHLQRLEARAAREREARKQAEAFLEQRSLELYASNLALSAANAELQTASALLRQNAEALEELVAARTRELAEANAALRETLRARELETQARDRFFATMSHEIRTPMHGILSLIELVAGEALDPVTRSRVEIIRGSADSLLTILNDVLDLARIQDQGVQLHPSPFDPAQLSTAVLELFRARAEEKGLELRLRLGVGLPPAVMGDAGRVRQIISNLVGNAVKFTAKGQVELALEAGPAGLTWRVTDTGEGLRPDQLERIFQAYRQADDETAIRHGGTGLGLHISRRLAQAMEGTLGASSRPGVGSIFTLTLPLPITQAPAPSRMETAESLAPGLRILVVDDNSVNLIVLDALLSKWGVRPVRAMDGDEALDCLAEEHYDLVLMDLHMPNRSGLETVRALRACAAGPINIGVPVLALTADILDQRRDECLAGGMQDLLSKPFRPDELFQAIRRWAPQPRPRLPIRR
jgi:signal transduction histidine kinase/ActR/RegA family two-component response regulator